MAAEGGDHVEESDREGWPIASIIIVGGRISRMQQSEQNEEAQQDDGREY